MRSAPRVTLLGLAILAASTGGVFAETTCRVGARTMARVDLFFGAGTVSPRAWRRFLATAVTPRFPEGLTSLHGAGQWRSPRGPTMEPTRILVIFYKPDATSDARIDAIRSIYKHRFAQTSVLRADSSACVGF